MMGGSGILTFAMIAMIAMMVVMMGGMIVGAGWGLVRHHRRRDTPGGALDRTSRHPNTH
jgi:hypothetical protein